MTLEVTDDEHVQKLEQTVADQSAVPPSNCDWLEAVTACRPNRTPAILPTIELSDSHPHDLADESGRPGHWNEGAGFAGEAAPATARPEPAFGTSSPVESAPASASRDSHLKDKSSWPSLEHSNEDLLKLCLAGILDKTQEAQLERNISNFEDRCRESAIPDAEKRKALEAIYHALYAVPKNEGVTRRKDRVELALGLTRQLADPLTIQQGFNGTCGLASLEVRIASLYPGKYAEFVTKVAIEGSDPVPGHSRKDSMPRAELQLDKTDLRPWQDNRSFASRVFQIAAANLTVQTRERYLSRDGNFKTVPPGGYLKYADDPIEERPDGDSGERVRVYDKEGKLVDSTNDKHPPLAHSDRETIYELITGSKEKFAIGNGTPGWYVGSDQGPRKVMVESLESFEQAIKKCTEGKELRFPLQIGVLTGLPPFNRLYGDGGGPHSQHALTIVGAEIDPGSGKIKQLVIHDTNGRRLKDHPIGDGYVSETGTYKLTPKQVFDCLLR